jgi:hypothetical protein
MNPTEVAEDFAYYAINRSKDMYQKIALFWPKKDTPA